MENVIINRNSANEAIDNFILDGNSSWRHNFIGDAQVPYCDHRNRLICSPVMPPMLNEDDDRMVRAKNEHEAGHARFTPRGMDDSWSGLKCKLVNVLEDLRMERLVSAMSTVFEQDLNWLNERLIAKLQSKMKSGTKSKFKPVDEAIMALHFEGNGHYPEWNMSGGARLLHDSAKAVFDLWKTADSFDQVIAIADKILDIWNSIQQGGKGEGSDEQDSDGNGQSGNGEEKSGNGNEKNGNEKSGKSNDNGDKTSSNSGDAKDGGESQDAKDGEENGGDGNASGERNGEEEDGQDGDGQESGSGDESDQYSNDGQGGNEQDGEEESGNEQDASGNDRNGSDGSDCSDGDDDGKSNSGSESNSSHGGRPDESDDCGNGPDDVSLDDLLDSDIENTGLDEELKEEWKDAVSSSQEVFGQYTSYTEKDVVIRAPENELEYNKAKDEVRGAISAIAGHLEQSLRSQSRCRTIHGRDRGSLDLSRIANIAKSLDRNIFSSTTKGISLNVAVTILIDESGSVYTMCADFRRMAVAFCEAIDRLGIKFEVLGHTTTGTLCNQQGVIRTRPMAIFEHKNFNESYRNERFRIGSIRNHECNIDGEALLYATKRLLAQRAERHVVMVLSDGEPNQGRFTEQLKDHLKSVVDLCRNRLGVEVYAFGVGTNHPEKFYGKDNFVYLKGSGSLDGEFIRRFSSIITNGRMK